MAITQVGIATASDELLQHIKNEVRNSGLEWNNMSDAPDYTGHDLKFLKATSGDSGSSMEWSSLPPTGLNWVSRNTNVTAANKIGYLASGGITITLPVNPVEGDLVAVADHYSEFHRTPVIVVPSPGDDIEGQPQLIVDLRNAYVQLIYDGDSWEISQLNHPFNLQEITEETFNTGSLTYIMSRVPANGTSILVTSSDGRVYPASSYTVTGSNITFNTKPATSFNIRYIGIPAATKVSEVPVGALMYFPNTNPVDGWLNCVGGTISSSVYPDLVKYLTKNDKATEATLPDARANFIRTWDSGTGIDTTDPVTLPVILKDNTWGRWLDTTHPSTSENLWDYDSNTRTTVSFADKRVGYAFDAPITVTTVDISCSDLIGVSHIPTTIKLQASIDGITWVDASTQVVAGSSLQNATVTLTNTLAAGNTYRYWSVLGEGGISYPSTPEYYWGVTSLVVHGTSINRSVGGFQEESVGDMSIALNGSSAGPGPVSAGAGETSIVTGGTGTISGGSETRPDNQAYVLKIKAFHQQGGSLTSTEITALRDEVSRLSGLVHDNSHVSGLSTIPSGQVSPLTVTQLKASRSSSSPVFTTILGASNGVTSIDKVVRVDDSNFELHFSGTPVADVTFSYAALEL